MNHAAPPPSYVHICRFARQIDTSKELVREGGSEKGILRIPSPPILQFILLCDHHHRAFSKLTARIGLHVCDDVIIYCTSKGASLLRRHTHIVSLFLNHDLGLPTLGKVLRALCCNPWHVQRGCVYNRDNSNACRDASCWHRHDCYHCRCHHSGTEGICASAGSAFVRRA